MGITPHFENIQEKIYNEIKKAEETILIAVAWFTNKVLFELLLEKEKQGVKISIIINDDDINNKSGIDWDNLITYTSKVYKIKNNIGILHNKFCVIDKKNVITGSYNWTNKAQYNSEDILIHSNNFELAVYYIEQFDKILEKFKTRKYDYIDKNYKLTFGIIINPFEAGFKFINKSDQTVNDPMTEDMRDLPNCYTYQKVGYQRQLEDGSGSFIFVFCEKESDIIAIYHLEFLTGANKGSEIMIGLPILSQFNFVGIKDYLKAYNI